jgi:hypothetical protein
MFHQVRPSKSVIWTAIRSIMNMSKEAMTTAEFAERPTPSVPLLEKYPL